MPRRHCAVLLAFGIAAGWTGLDEAHAADWSARGAARLFSERIAEAVVRAQLRHPRLTTDRTSERTALQLHAMGSVQGRPTDALGLRLGLDTGLFEVGTDGTSLDGRDVSERLLATGLLGETWAELQLGETGAVAIRAGKLRPRLADGLLFDAYALGVLADLELDLLNPELPVDVRLQVLLPDGTFTADGKKSPLVDLELAYRFARRTEVRVFGVLMLDADDGLSTALSDAVGRARAATLAQSAEALIAGLPPRVRAFVDANDRQLLFAAAELYNEGAIGYEVHTKGRIGWTGASGSLSLGALELSVTGVLGFGRLDVESSPNQDFRALIDGAFVAVEERFGIDAQPVRDRIIQNQTTAGQVRLRAAAGRATARFAFTRDLSVDAFLLGLTGDEGLLPSEGQPAVYNAFVALAPLLAHTSIFFNGGVANTLSSPTLVSASPDGAGLVAGGIGVELFPIEAASIRAVGALMSSLVPGSQTSGSFYGAEVNLRADWAITSEWLASIDGALFLPGGYYGDVPVGLQLIVALQAVLR